MIANIWNKIVVFVTEQYAKLKNSKNKTRDIIVLIFILLMVYGLFVFIGMYFSGEDMRKGFMNVSGRIEGYEYHASTRASGKVLEMFVDEGDNVTQGQVIATIQSKQQKALFEEANSKLHLAELEYNRYKNLFEKKAVAKNDYDRAKENYDVASETVARTKADLEDATVVAPISGTVVLKIVRPGEVVAAGTPLVTIINMNDLYMQIFLATDYAGKINLGDEAKIFPDALLKTDFLAYVNRISPKAEFTPKNVETKSQRAKLVFGMKLKVKENKGLKLKPGMPSSGVIKFAKKAKWNEYKR